MTNIILFVSICKKYNAMFCWIRYGQDEIQEMLIARGAKESVQVPKDNDCEMPSWVRKSSRIENKMAK